MNEPIILGDLKLQFSHAVRAGNTIYASGQASVDLDTGATSLVYSLGTTQVVGLATETIGGPCAQPQAQAVSKRLADSVAKRNRVECNRRFIGRCH